MMRLGWSSALVSLAGAALMAAPQVVAARQVVSIGAVSSAKTCTTYVMSSGKSSFSASQRSGFATDGLEAAGASHTSVRATESWRTWLEKDCVQNFPTLRTSLEAALASSGHFAVRAGGYRINLKLSDVGNSASANVNTPGYQPEAYASVSSLLFVNLDITITDQSGHFVYGGVLTKSIDISHASGASEFGQASAQDGNGISTLLQHEAALAAARLVIFHIDPIRVVGLSGNRIKLNYGQPVLPFGGILRVKSGDGFDDIRFRVTSSDEGSAIAERDGDGNVSRIPVGSVASFVENDSKAANGRRLKRDELP